MAIIRGNRFTVALCAVVFGLIVPGAALAHLERPSYWPDPSPDTSVRPAAGGGVPTARSLRSAVTARTASSTKRSTARRKKASARRRGAKRRRSGQRRVPAYTGSANATDVRVVCQGTKGSRSLQLAQASISQARAEGYVLRPSQPKIRLTAKQAADLLEINRRLRDQCRFSSIQDAVDASGNNDRVVIMPGTYTEPESRKQPENDPRCNPSLLQKDASGDPTPSYEYQVTCPHDQNLVYVQGRAVKGKPLAEPRSDRRGIPEQELGRCVRCNLQIEGSGAKPEDVIIDAGTDYQGTGAEARPGGHAKDVVLRADRADGFVGRNFLVRGAKEHGFYTEESDGTLLDRMKFFWNADYGHLAFTSDHQRIQNCDGMGAGDAALYPGATPETGSQTTDFYPDGPRYNTTVTKCDMRHSNLGYSGSMGNAVRITGNHIYGNATGIASDTLSSAGHPGFPTDGTKIDNNLIYANNFNVYAPDSPVKPLVTLPVGAGVIYPGVNDARVHDNWFFDNWRYGTMLFAVPDPLTRYGGPEGDVFPGVSCLGAPENKLSTSCGNHYFNNKMGQVPPGFTFPAILDKYKVPHSENGAARMPNGTDFWWDEFLSNRGNCWYGNTGPDGTAGSVTGSGQAGTFPGLPPNPLPDCAGGQNQNLSVGNGDIAKEAYLVECAQGPKSPTGGIACDWYESPPKPGSPEEAQQRRENEAAALAYSTSPQAGQLQALIDGFAAGAVPRR